MEQGTLPREYRTRSGSAAGLYALLGFVWLFGAARMATARFLPVWYRVAFVVLLGAFIAFVVYARPRRFTVLDEKGISVRGLLGVRRLGWDELHDVRAEAWPEQMRTVAGAPRVFGCAYRADGKRVVLPCVDDREVAGVHAEVARIRSVWTRLRGPRWEPDPAAEARIARDAARRDRWVRAGSGWAVPVVATVVIIAVIVLCLVLFD
ncbi:hypothetical protein [Streptomyces sp. NBC_00096]|uniref:hypothetical protein n=1 Tax=Streptomyces sp. NBC_00096 TaxID=2975650 RepID=UPI003254A3F6